MKASRLLAPLLLLICSGFAQRKNTPLEAPANPNPQLYRANVNASEEISKAKLAAARQHKRILLVFGANWCMDCHVLDNAFHRPRIAPLLNANFLVVHVDVGKYDKNLELAKQYHVDLEKGVPEIAVLNTSGGLLYSTSEFEKARVLSEEDVVKFLNDWKPPQPATKAAISK